MINENNQICIKTTFPYILHLHYILEYLPPPPSKFPQPPSQLTFWGVGPGTHPYHIDRFILYSRAAACVGIRSIIDALLKRDNEMSQSGAYFTKVT